MKFQHLILAVLVGLALLVGCKKDDNPVTPPPAGPTTTTLIGSIAGSTSGGAFQSGRLNLTFTTAKPLAASGDTSNVSGKIFLSTGDTVTLTGIFVHSTGHLEVSGSGYSIVGTLTNGQFNGSYTGPGGYSGTVAASSSGSGHTITVYCGQYTETSGGTNTGTFNMVVDGGSVTVITSDGNTFYGTLSSGTFTIYVAGTSGTVLAGGTLSGTHASGDYNTGSSSGTWFADACQ
jgi:hypothetical protein